MAVDYQSIIYGKKDPAEGMQDKAWWLQDDKDIPNTIESVVSFLHRQQSSRFQQIYISSRLYGNLSLLAGGMTMPRFGASKTGSKDRITYNVCQSVVDTITAKIAKNKPKPYFLTSGGDYKLKRKAKKLTKFVDGCFYENDVYKMAPDIFRDACNWGDGVMHVYSRNKKIRVERVPIAELYCDEMEAFYRKPRQMHRAKNIDRKVLIANFPEHKDKIMAATKATFGNTGVDSMADLVTAIESWHLPSDHEAGDGLHTITIQDCVLLREEWKRDHFPFAIFSWSKRIYGFYSQGLIEQIQNIQTEINKLLWVIQRSMHLAGSFKIWLQTGTKIPKEHFNNEIGTILTGETAPQYIVPPIVAPEVYSHLNTLKNAAYEQAGISQLSAASQKPAGLNSGAALREYNDIESDRFQTVGQAYEQFHIDVAKLMVDEARTIYETEDKSFKVKVPGKKFIETIAWKDVNMPDDQFVMQIFPVSKLPDEPAGRLQAIQEMMQSGLISPATGRRLLDYPDLESEESLANAQEDLIHYILEKIVEEGDYTPPEPTDDLTLAQKLCLEYISVGRKEGLEEEKLDLLRTFLTQVQLLQLKASQPDPSQQPPPGGAPQGPPQGNQPMANPTPAPTSDLLQNTLNAPVAA